MTSAPTTTTAVSPVDPQPPAADLPTSGAPTEDGSTAPHKSSILTEILQDLVTATSKVLSKKDKEKENKPPAASAAEPLPPAAVLPPLAAQNVMQPVLPPPGAYYVQPPIAYSADGTLNWKLAIGSVIVAVMVGTVADSSGVMSYYPTLSERISSVLPLNCAVSE